MRVIKGLWNCKNWEFRWRLFKIGFAKTIVIRDKGSCSSAWRCSETLLQVHSGGILLSIDGTCIRISQEKAALLNPASSFCLDLCILATKGCKRKGGKARMGFPLGAFDICLPALTQHPCPYPAFQ